MNVLHPQALVTVSLPVANAAVIGERNARFSTQRLGLGGE
jgi:hypothetical protein